MKYLSSFFLWHEMVWSAASPQLRQDLIYAKWSPSEYFLSSSLWLCLWCGLQEWLGDFLQGYGEQRQSHLGDHKERLRGHGEKTVTTLKPDPADTCREINQLSSRRRAQALHNCASVLFCHGITATKWREKFLLASYYQRRFTHLLYFFSRA